MQFASEAAHSWTLLVHKLHSPYPIPLRSKEKNLMAALVRATFNEITFFHSQEGRPGSRTNIIIIGPSFFISSGD